MVWFHAAGADKSGPISFEDMLALLRAGRIDGETKIWNAGLDGWRPLREVEVFAAALAEVTPPPATTPATAASVASAVARSGLRRKLLLGFGGVLAVVFAWLAWSGLRGPSSRVSLTYECLAFHRVMLQKFRQEANATRAAATEKAGREWLIRALSHESQSESAKAEGVRLMRQAELEHRRHIAQSGWAEFERRQAARCVIGKS